MKMSKYFLALCVTLGVCLQAHAADVKFEAWWTAPTHYANGAPIDKPLDGYKLYACDAPLTPNLDASSAATCTGNMVIFNVLAAPTETAPFANMYTTSLDKGTLYFRVTAIRKATTNNGEMDIESALSEESTMTFETVVATNPPGTIKIEGGNQVIIIK